jgi:hypothetical protein
VSKVEIYEAQDFHDEDLKVEAGPKDWRWRVRAGNGEIVASGEGYTREEDALRGFKTAAVAVLEASIPFL